MACRVVGPTTWNAGQVASLEFTLNPGEAIIGLFMDVIMAGNIGLSMSLTSGGTFIPICGTNQASVLFGPNAATNRWYASNRADTPTPAAGAASGAASVARALTLVTAGPYRFCKLTGAAPGASVVFFLLVST